MARPEPQEHALQLRGWLQELEGELVGSQDAHAIYPTVFLWALVMGPFYGPSVGLWYVTGM